MLTLIILCSIGSGNVWGTDFTLSSASSVTQDGITVSFAKGSGSTAPTWYAAGLRLYGSNTVTISCSNNITAITFNWEKQGSKAFATATASTGTYSHPTITGTGTWSGSATSITFTLGSSGQLQLNTFSVTASGGTSYTVSYNANGGTGTMTNSTGASITLKECTFTAPVGKEFNGWNTAANGSGASYTDQQTGITANLTLYAQWSCITPTISAQPSNGSCVQGGSPSPITVTASGGTLGYQWKQSATSGGTYTNVSGGSGGTTASYTPPVTTIGTTYYKCVITNTGSSCGTTVTSNAVSFEVTEPAAAASVHLENYSGSDPTDLHVGDSYTLPSLNSATCNGKTFVGWSTVEVDSPTKPGSNFYEPGGSVTISSASMTIYAVFATGTPGSPVEHAGPSFSRSGSSNTITSGYTFTAAAEAKTGYYQDGSGTLRSLKLYHTSTAIFSSTPSRVVLTAVIGGGTARDPLGNSVMAQLLDKDGNGIGNATTVTSKITTAGGDEYNIDLDLTDITSAYGVMIYHTKESSYNVRYYSFSLTYYTGGGTTYSNYTTTCGAVDPTVTFSNGEYTVGGSALDLRTLWTSNNNVGAVTFTVTNANGTGATIAGDGYSLSATTAGSCTVQASQAAVAGVWNAISRTATITVNPPTCATPTFNNGTGTYNNDVTVAISCATASSTIHYTTGASPADPTCSSGSTGTSVTISATGTTLKAVACKDGFNVSAVASATYTLKCATPTFSVAAGTYTSTQSVELSCTTTDAVIHYTVDGSTPTAGSPTYSSAITVDDDMTIKAIAFKTNYASSDAAEAAYRIKNCTWYKSFDTNSGNGGNNGTWSGISSFSSPSFDNSGWTVTSGGAGDACIKSGTSGTKGSATTPAITVDNGATGKVKFRMGPWNSTGSSAQVVFTGAEVSTGVSTWTSADAMSNGEWNDYQVDFTTTGTSLTIEFTVSGGDNRFWLDEVCVKMDPAAYTVTFNANGHGTAPDPITNVAKNSTISKPTPDPSATGWTFGGWYKEPACTNAWTWATDQVTSNTTLYAKWTCSNPTSLSISSSGSKYDFCAGESMTLTVSGSNIGTGATYQWSLGGSPIDGATSASYTTTMAAAKAGEYTCTVSNGSCSQTTSGFWVRVWQLYIDNGAAGAWQALDFTNTGTGTGNNTTVALDADGTYHFKLKDNTGGFFGLNSKTVTGTESNITLNGTGANVNVNAGIGGNYTFAINYSDKNNPKISITYPTANQAAGKKIWFDKSIITGWNVAQTSDLYYRIGHTSYSQSNNSNWTLVPGTDRFYEYTTTAFNGFAAWQIANNKSQNDGSTSIYVVNGGQNITKSIVHQKYVVGDNGVTLVPGSSTGSSDGCTWYAVTKTDGMLTHTATITTPSHGTIHLAYTDVNSAAQDKTSTTAGLAHRTKITASADPDPGYQLSTFTVTPSGESPQNITSGVTDNHILAKDATFAATFGAKTITITWNGNGGTPSKASDTWVYDAAALASLPSATNGSKIFVGWFTLADGGSQIDNVGGSNKPTADVEYFAHWSDGNTVYFNPGAGTVTPASATQTSIGGSVSLPTPTPTCDGWTFQGWKVGSTQTEVTELPAGLVTGSYVPESATVQMYAVYKKTFEETTPVTSTYDWDSSVSGWSGDWTNITQNKGSQGVGGSYCGQFSANGAYVQYPTSLSSKVKVTNFSLYMRRSSNNTKGTGKIQKSTDGSNWTDVLTWSMSDIAQSECTQKSTTFDGSTEYYMRFFYVADGSAIRYIDNVSITYNTVDDVTHYATNPLECTQVATPVITPAGNTLTGAQSITISCATDGATIRYTTDGTNPSKTVGTVIASGSSFTLSCSGTVKAIAYKDGMADSDIASETYTIKVPDPTFSPDGGDFKVAQSVSISDALAGTTVYYEYTTDGSEPSDPTASSTAYSSTIPVAVGQTVRIKAIGINACCSNSDIVSKTFRVGWDFELVTNEDDLNVGDKIVVLSGSTNALSTYNEASYNRTATSDFDLSGTTVTAYPPSTNSATTVQVITRVIPADGALI